MLCLNTAFKNYKDAVQHCFMSTSSSSMTLLCDIGFEMLKVESCYLLLSFHINIKSIAASLDDLTTLGILASIGEFLFKIIGVGGNLVAVQASRLSTTFHQQGKPREIQNITQ
ncbi:unnamed protein product [Adineta steineri]|uniref:Uncharacterized protein n=1 Tax=Adineta steineri TaxID=433720 RepID=A0A815LG53_9BILA|nr:unnamed protein product [Adineta steineri]